jgi:virulence-associated protein VagC
MKINEVVQIKKYEGILAEGIFYNENILKEQLLYENFIDSAKQYLGTRINDTIADISGNITDMRTAGVLIKDVIQNPAYLEKVNIQLLKTCNGFIKQINRLSLSSGLVKAIWEKISLPVSNLIRAMGWKGFLGRLGVAGLLKYILVNANRLQANILDLIVENILDLENLISTITMTAFFNLFEGIALIKRYFLDILSEIKNKLDFGRNIGVQESILIERRQQKTGEYYHGTSTKFLRSILKQGLLKNPPKRVYSPDGIPDEGQRTFPNAVYLTNNFETAEEASIWATDVFGGNPMIVVVQYVYNSGEMDEDVFTFKISSFLRTEKTKEGFVKKILQQFRGMKYNETIVTGLVEKLYDVIISFMEDNKLSRSSLSNLPDGDIVNAIRLHPPYEETVSELLRRVNPKKAETVRVPRDIGFSGKTKIIQIFNPETDEILYPIERITLDYLLTGVQTNSNVKPDAKYFMYGDYQEYIWGIGTNIKETIIDAAKEMAKSANLNLKNSDDMNIFRSEWDMERDNCQIYAMDEEAFNRAKEDAFFVMDKNEKGEITVSKHDRSKRKNESETINYIKPQFDKEWEEAARYSEFLKIGKENWIELASTGKSVTVTQTTVSKINNTDAADVKSFKMLDHEKQKRALTQVSSGNVELPVVARYSDGYLELIGGNTRLTALMAKYQKAKIWLFDVPEELNEIILEETYDGNKFFEAYGYIPEILEEAEYQGRTVTLNKPVRSSDGPKKFHVYVKNDKGNIVKVNFGDPDMKIKKNIPARKKSFRARHHCDTDPGPKWKARYWSCRAW